MGGNAGWLPPTTQACLPGAARLIGERDPNKDGQKPGGQGDSGGWCLGKTGRDCQWAEIGEPLGRGAEADTRQRKQRSRKQECVGVRENQRSLIKCRVEGGGGKDGG